MAVMDLVESVELVRIDGPVCCKRATTIHKHMLAYKQLALVYHQNNLQALTS